MRGGAPRGGGGGASSPGASLTLETATNPAALNATPSPGVATKASASDHAHPTTGLAPAQEAVNAVATSGAAQTIPDPVTAQSISRVTLSANCTLTFPAVAAGKSFTLVLVQDGTGSRTVTWPGTVLWASGVAPTLTTAASKRDVFSFLSVDGTNWLGFVSGQNF